MTTNLDRYRKDLASLLTRGSDMEFEILHRENSNLKELSADDKARLKKLSGLFENSYQKWYSESLSLIRQLMPDRLEEFIELYRTNSRRKTVDISNFTIQDWLNGYRANTELTGQKKFNDYAVVVMRFHTQIEIIKAVEARFESSLFDIRQLIHADLLDSEIEAARELLKAGFLRAAGAVCGVVIERHLTEVLSNHSVQVRKSHPAIADLNDALKAASVYDTPVWRNIQRLGDLRNLCDHKKHREPTADDVQELIDGTDKITKTIF